MLFYCRCWIILKNCSINMYTCCWPALLKERKEKKFMLLLLLLKILYFGSNFFDEALRIYLRILIILLQSLLKAARALHSREKFPLLMHFCYALECWLFFWVFKAAMQQSSMHWFLRNFIYWMMEFSTKKAYYFFIIL